MHPTLILASSSQYRRKQLSQLTTNFACISADIDESPLPGEQAEALSIRLAVSKALAVKARAPAQSLIIGADQCAALGKQILGKPLTTSNASKQLSACSGSEVVFYSGVCVLEQSSDKTLSASVQTIVKFRPLSREEIDTYLEREEVLDCAGSFKCEGLGISLFDRISSEDPSALIGLPLIRLNHLLFDLGVNLLTSRAQKN